MPVKHDPQPDEIRRECEKIQAGYSRADEKKRRCQESPRVEAVIIDCKEVFGDSDPYER